MPRTLSVILAAALACVVGQPASAQQAGDPSPAEKLVAFQSHIDHVLVIYQENWSFDGLYAEFPGCTPIAADEPAIPQRDMSGSLYATLPPCMLDGKPDHRFPPGLPVAPFNCEKYIRPDDTTGDLLHRFYQQQFQINSGKMDRFIAWSDAGGLVMSRFNAADMPEGRLARQFTLCDRFFHAAFGGSFLNHIFLIAADAPRWPDAPKHRLIDPDPQHFHDGVVTSDGYAVNTCYSTYQPRPPKVNDQARLLPPQTMPTIGDRLSDAGVSWKWYAGGWNDAVAGRADAEFQFHHQPFVYFTNYAPGTQARTDHLQDETDFWRDLAAGVLPHVAFLKLLGPDNEHPGYATLLRGQEHVAKVVEAVQRSAVWGRTLIIITYDENGGRWDHVPPPRRDRWGPGVRVPTIVISPFARRGYVDHTTYDTLAILGLIERRYGLPPLSDREPKAGDLLNAMDFAQPH